MRIGKVEIIGDALLAPIAGFTDVGFRDVARRYGASLTYTEMISGKGMIYGSEKTRELLATTDIECPKAAQIFGADPDILSKAVNMRELEKFDIIDVNMGCPVPKIVKCGEGSALLNTPEVAVAVVKALTRATDKPITVKTRLGFNHHDFTAVDFAKRLQDAGASAITVHGRTREDFYNGHADWDKIASVVGAVEIPVIANGDVTSLASYIAILEYTRAAGVMIARGALGNPQLFLEIAKYRGINTLYNDIDIKRDIMRQIEVLQEYYTERYIYCNMKKHICYYVKGKQGSAAIKNKVCHVESLQELLDVVNEIF